MFRYRTTRRDGFTGGFGGIPIDITNLQFFIEDGIITDKSPNAYTINNTGVTLGSADLNGKDVFLFDGSSYLELANTGDVDITGAFTIHIVVKLTVSNNCYLVMKGDNETANATQYFINYNSSGDKFVGRIGSGTSNHTVDYNSPNEATYEILSFRYIPSGDLYIYSDGILQNTQGGVPSGITARTEKLTIGAHSTAAKQFKLDGAVGSVIIRDSSDIGLLTADIARLKAKYAIA